jgi:putative DNA primase/helicase
VRVLDRYPWVGEVFSVIREEKCGARVICDCNLRAHRTSRLNLWLGDDGRLMLHCFACGKERTLEILRAAGLTWKDCYPQNTDWKAVRREVVARYDYRDEQRVLLYQKLRLEPGYRGSDKTFIQRRPLVPGTEPRRREDWVKELGDVRRVLYRLPELLAADPALPVWKVAGEKDVHSLLEIGFGATTNSEGEGGAWLESYSRTLENRHVVVIEDADATGKRHADAVVGSLTDYAASVRRLRLPQKDATAFLTQARRAGLTGRKELRTALLAELSRARTWVGVG